MKVTPRNSIQVNGANEKNLQNVRVTLPKKNIIVFTGVSGSGKSALVFDTIAAESQRQLNETYSSFIQHRLPHYGHPNVDSIENLSVSIVINQKRMGRNTRSTVGTITDINSFLRLLFSRAGTPFVGESDVFSFNNPQGMCKQCEGLGRVNTFKLEKLIDLDKSLQEGAIQFPTFGPGEVRWKRYVTTGLFDNYKKLKDYSADEWDTLLYQFGFKPPNPTAEWPPTSTYEGVIPRIERTFLSKDSRDAKRYKDAINRVVAKETCPLCQGSRLNQLALSCKLNGKSIADCMFMSASSLLSFMRTINEPSVQTIIEAITFRLEQLVAIGIGYVTLDRATSTLSGGESQRIKMVRQLGNSLTDLMYIFDEPSIGLHPHDVHSVNRLLQHLRDKGNTVIIVEHDPDVIQIADRIIDMGPKAGVNGGKVVYEGNLEGLIKSESLTGTYLKFRPQLKKKVRRPSGWLPISHASLYNLKNVTVEFPKGVMTAVTGVAGSGKSTLLNHVFPTYYPKTLFIDQGAIHTSRRSNVATFTGIFDAIRNRFAKQNGVNASLFSFNAKGACPACKGTGTITTDLAFMETIETVCETCKGYRYREDVLRYFFHGKTISDVISMTVEEALEFFTENDICPTLQKIEEVGLGYLSLGQPLHTLSGGERQRVKLANELDSHGEVYVLDEPTTGLHLSDCRRLLHILNRLVNQGSTVIVIEHNLDIISQSDWVIDLGPGAGEKGGNVVFSGEPKNLLQCEASFTGKYLKSYRE